MNRAKFRAWDSLKKEWICKGYSALGEVTLFGIIEQHLMENLEGKRSMLDRLEDVIESQWTGLYDINKVEIYDGDIIKCSEYDPFDHRVVQTFKCSVVGFDFGCYYYFPYGNMMQPHQLLMYAHNPVVIGNIYENPEICQG